MKLASKIIILLEESIIYLFQILIISGFTYLFYVRLLPKLPRDVFAPVSFERGLCYLFLWLINLIILILLIKYKLSKNNKITIWYLFVNDLNSIIEKSFSNFKKTIIYFPGRFVRTKELIIFFIAKQLLKIHPTKYHFWNNSNQILLLLTLSIDVFYFEVFYYFYFASYLLVIELIIKFLISLCITLEQEALQEMTRSMVVVNVEKAVRGEPLLPEDYELTEKNTEYSSVQEILIISDKVLEEYDDLLQIEGAIYYKSFFFKVITRVIYVIIWSYVLYYYPYSIISTLLVLIHKFILHGRVSTQHLAEGTDEIAILSNE
jgi:hypothetical protein